MNDIILRITKWKQYNTAKLSQRENTYNDTLYRCSKAHMSQMKHVKWKTATQILVITVNVNGLNAPVERQNIRLDKIKRTHPSLCYLQEISQI